MVIAARHDEPMPLAMINRPVDVGHARTASTRPRNRFDDKSGFQRDE
jgi:hypothetical protein